MKSFRFFTFLLAALLAVNVYAGPKGITVNDWSIESVLPTSFSSVDGKVKVNVTNSRKGIHITDISGIIYNKGGEMFIIGTADDLFIPKNTSDIVVTGHGHLSSYSVLLSLLRNFSLKPADYTADVKATVKIGKLGKARVVEMKQVPLSNFL